jgi:proteic killer suppression protein
MIDKSYLSLPLVSFVVTMIVSFGSKDTEKIWKGERSGKIPVEIQKIGRRKMRMIHNAQNSSDLVIPPSNHLKKLSGSRSGFFSIRINDQWRIISKWQNNQAFDVEIIDYH